MYTRAVGGGSTSFPEVKGSTSYQPEFQSPTHFTKKAGFPKHSVQTPIVGKGKSSSDVVSNFKLHVSPSPQPTMMMDDFRQEKVRSQINSSQHRKDKKNVIIIDNN